MSPMLMLLTVAVATSSMAKPHPTTPMKHVSCDSAADMVAIEADPDASIVVSAPQSFMLVLRTVADGGMSWRLRPDPANAGVFAPGKGPFSLSDVSFNHVEDPSAPPLVGGASASYFPFRVESKTAATKTLTFDEFGPGRDAKPRRTRTFHITVKANPSAC